MLIQNGIPTAEDLSRVTPSAERLARGPVAITECFQCIPCNPCRDACPHGAIQVEPDINATPVIDTEKCIGCGLCVAACPGLAIFVADGRPESSAVTIPYEYLPVPKKGDIVTGLDRAGKAVGRFEVLRAVQGRGQNLTWMITLSVPQDQILHVRGLKVEEVLS